MRMSQVFGPGKLMSRVLGAAVLLLVAAPGCALPAYDYRGEPDPGKVQYVLGPGDMVEIGSGRTPTCRGGCG